jgi:hypothetical protein
MSLTNGEIVRLIVQGTMGSVVWRNVWWFRSSEVSGVPDYDQIAQDLVDNMYAFYFALQASEVHYENANLVNMSNGVDFTDVPLTAVGTSTGALFATFAAYGVLLHRSTLLTRNGAKRIPGVVEEICDNGVITYPGSTQGDIESALSGDNVLSGSGWEVTLSPVIVKRNTDGTPDLGVFSFVNSATAKTFVTTQNSRKYGHGE